MRPLSAKFLSGVLAAAVLLPSCKKDTSDVGLDLLQGDQLQGIYTDTVTVISHTMKVDSIKTSKQASVICGNYYDPIFGVTNASFYAQLIPEKYGSQVDFSTNPQIDSIVLSLTYRSYYGRPAPLNFKVFQVTQRMYSDSIYNSDTSLTYNTLFPLADVTLEPNTIDSVHADGHTYAPQLRIKLDKVLLGGLLTPSIYATQEGFLDIFNGIHVTATPTGLSGSRAVYMFNPSDANTKVKMYYHDSALNPLTFTYTMGGSAQRFNHFDHDYTTAAPSITAQITSPLTVQEDVVYIQGLAGLQVKLSIPYLQRLEAQGEVAINKAELVIKADPNTVDGFFSTPTQLIVVALDSDGKFILTPDLLEGTSYSGGTYDAANKEYHFNIGRYLQGVLNGSITDRGLMLIPSGSSVNPNRVVLGGAGPNSAYRMKLKITYTKL